MIGYLLLLAAIPASPQAASPGPTVQLWDRWSESFTARESATPETAVVVELIAPSGRLHRVPCFWDGEQTWRVRFMPGEAGQWRYRTASTPAVQGLDAREGSFYCLRSAGSSNSFLTHGPVRVSASRRYLEHQDGTPFFWLGDTAWNGALLSTKQDWDIYLADRAQKGFTAIQFVMTAPWRTAPADAEGRVAFTGLERVQVHPRFFDRIDERIDAVNARGLLAVPVLLWAIRGEENPGHYLPEDQATLLERYMVARYGAHHVVWIPAGDARYEAETAERWKRIGRAVFGNGHGAPVIMHPGGMQWPWEAFRDERWMSLVGYQSGHGDSESTLRWIHSGPPSVEWRRDPVRPFLNIEPPYEDHVAYQSKKPHSAYNVRRACYWSLLNAPPAGLTYGAHGIWSWQTAPGVPLNHNNTGLARPWREAIALPGSSHMKHLAELFGSLSWWSLRPAPEVLVTQPGQEDPARFVSAARTNDGEVLVFYLPAGGEIRIRPPVPDSAEWFDPRKGLRAPAQQVESGQFRAPDEQDWVLVLRKPN